MDSESERVAFGFLDVLGTRALIEQMTMHDLAESLVGPLVTASEDNGTQESVNERSVGKEELEEILAMFTRAEVGTIAHLVLADSILVSCHPLDASVDAAVGAIFQIADFMAASIMRCSAEGVYLRGSISFGEMVTRARGRPVYMGMPMLEAMEWEHYQDWCGAMLAPSALEVLFSEESRQATRERFDRTLEEQLLRTSALTTYDVPLKPGSPPLSHPAVAVDLTRHGLYLSWFEGCFVPPVVDLDMPEPVQLKMRNTLAFVEAMAERARLPF